MNDSSQPPLLASVLYLRLAEFAGKPVVEQARLRAQLEAAVGVGVRRLPPADRVVLDTSDGQVVVVLGNINGTLEAAERCLEAAHGLPVCIGLNHGPVALAADSVPGMVGDGLRSAGVAAGFAKPGQVLATRGFREAIGAHAPVRGVELLAAGTFSDSSVRTHELFVADRRVRVPRRRRLLGIAALCGIVLLGGAAGVRAMNHGYGVLAAPATVTFDIKPRGDVFVDGVAVGSAPALKTLTVRPGPHRIEVKLGDEAPYLYPVDAAPGQQIPVQYEFYQLAGLIFLNLKPGGQVFIDGELKGTLPLQRLELRAGRHTVEVRYGNAPGAKKEIVLVANQDFIFRPAAKKKECPWYKPWCDK